MSDRGGVAHHEHGSEGDEHSHDHDHSHGHGGSASSRKVALVSGINIVGFAVELAGGYGGHHNLLRFDAFDPDTLDPTFRSGEPTRTRPS